MCDGCVWRAMGVMCDAWRRGCMMCDVGCALCDVCACQVPGVICDVRVYV